MRRLLVINPNTSQSVSTLLQTHVQASAGLHVQVHTTTARFGAPYISDEAGYAVAAHAALDACDHHIRLRVVLEVDRADERIDELAGAE